MKENLNEDFFPIVKEHYINVKGKATKKSYSTYRMNKNKKIKRSIYVGAAVLALISSISFANSKTGKEIKYGMKIEKVFSDRYNKDPEFAKLSDSLDYCYDAGYGMPILSSITDPFEFGTPDCENPECITCRKNKEIRKELDNLLMNNSEYVAAKNNYLDLQGIVIDMDSNNGGMSK